MSRNPFFAWANLAYKTGELMFASAQVVRHRSHRIATSGPSPSRRDRREFALMGQEKLIGFGESAAAMTASMPAYQRLAVTTFAHGVAANAAMLSLWNSRNATEAVARQIRLAQTMARATSTLGRLSSSAASLTLTGVEPLSRIAKANSRRLRKR